MLDSVSQVCANEFGAAFPEALRVWALDFLDLHLGRPVVRDALTVFPILSDATVTSRGYDLSSTDLIAEERTGHAVVAEPVVTTMNAEPRWSWAARLVGDLRPLYFQSGVLLGIAGQAVQLEASQACSTSMTLPTTSSLNTSSASSAR